MSVHSFTLFVVPTARFLTEEEFDAYIETNRCCSYLFNLPETMQTDWTPDGRSSVLSLIVRGILAENGWTRDNMQMRLVETRINRPEITSVRKWLHCYIHERHKLRMNPLQTSELLCVLQDLEDNSFLRVKERTYHGTKAIPGAEFDQIVFQWAARTDELVLESDPLATLLATQFETIRLCVSELAKFSYLSKCHLRVADNRVTAILSKPV